MKYTLHDFQTEFPTDDSCLDFIFKRRFPHLRGHKRIKGRKGYYSRTGKQIFPLKGTIFERSSTPLSKWFFVMFLFSNSKHGVSAKEVQRALGCTYKCAWRMCRQIRLLMRQGTHMLTGTVEADETYIGGTRKLNSWKRPKSCVVGMKQRGGELRAKVLNTKSEYDIVNFVENNLEKGSTLYTDCAPVYNICQGYKRGRVMHSAKEYVNGDIHTNSIEGAWSILKRSIRGTHSFVSKRYLQLYLDEMVFRYNHRNGMFFALMERV